MNKLDIDAIVDDYHKLDRNFIPDDLIYIDNNENNFHRYIDPTLKPALSKVAYDNYKELEESSIKDGLHIVVGSGFRPYVYQERIWIVNYKKYLEKCMNEQYPYLKAYDITSRYVAHPGASEHQTGYAFDFGSYDKDVFRSRSTEEEKKWMYDNSYKYGFILRYPKGKESITGFNYESWHYRYVGKDIANIIHNNGDYLTLEEYHKVLKKK